MTEHGPAGNGDAPKIEPDAVHGVHNTVSTPVMPGVVIQSGTIHGGIHHQSPAHQIPTPQQLPPAPRHFSGRATELTQLTAALDATTAEGTTVVISALAGMGGIGKTALAVHWARANRHRFPDGHLFVDLQGFAPAGAPLTPAEAVRGFLNALGIAADQIPADLQAQTGLYRSLVSGKQMLIVLDNAASVEQVIPLLPGSPTCTVIITCRHRLATLSTTYGAHVLDLDVLPTTDAQAVLAHHLGSERLAAEPQAVAELLTVCAGLPLAVRIVAARAEHHRTFPLTVLAEELREVAARLDGLNAGDLHSNIRVVLSWSARALTTAAANVFKLLGIAPGPDIGLSAAASLTALSEEQVRVELRELENASLVYQHLPGRYQMHDLIFLYATETAHLDLTEDLRETALRRVLDFYVHSAHTADRLLTPHAPLSPVLPDPPSPGVHIHVLPDSSAATAWFAAEHLTLLAAQHTAADRAWYPIVWHLARAMNTFLSWQGHHHDRLTVWRAALVATHAADPAVQTITHRLAGCAYVDLGCHDDAMWHLHQALALAEEQRNPDQKARTHRAFALAWERQGNHRQALEHATHVLYIYRALDEPMWEADALRLVGWFMAQLGDYDTANTHCQTALSLWQHHNNPDYEAGTMLNMGYIAHHTRHYRQAIDYYQRAITLFRAVGNSAGFADALDALGHPYVAVAEKDQARTAWNECLLLYQQQERDDDASRVQHQLDSL